MVRRSLRLAVPAFAAACLPVASAHAATYVVDPAKPTPGCTGTSCKTIKSALAAVADGDTIRVKPGAYGEDGGLDITKANITLTTDGAAGTAAVTAVTPTAGVPVLKLTGAGAKVSGLLLSVQQNGGPALDVVGINANVEQVSMLNVTASTQNLPMVRITAASGTTRIAGGTLLHTPVRETALTVPTIQGAPASSLVLEGLTVVSGANVPKVLDLDGNAANTPNRIISSSLIGLKGDATAVDVFSASASTVKKELKINSSLLQGGPSGIGLVAASQAAGFPSNSNSGDIDIDVLRATVAGSGRASVLNAAADGEGGILGGSGPKGSIDVSVTRSIWKGTNELSNHDGNAAYSDPNTAKLSITNSDTDQAPVAASSGTEVVAAQNTNTPPTSLFFDPGKRNFHLRQDAPVVDKGGEPFGEEPAKDIDGQARKSGSQADIGADEFVNQAPVAKVTGPAEPVGANAPVTLDASGSSDLEAGRGGGIAKYVWDFGDGQSQETTTPRVEHPYGAPGTYDVKLTVVDNAGASSANPATVKVNVKDGTPPTVSITSVKAGDTLRLFRTKKVLVERRGRVVEVTERTPLTTSLSGDVSDDTELGGTELSLRRLVGGQCRYVDLKTGKYAGTSCSKPRFFGVGVREGKFSFRTKRSWRLRAGNYELTARATDKAGNVSTSVVRFRFR